MLVFTDDKVDRSICNRWGIEMRLLPILIMMVCCSASAEWLLFSKADNGDKHYVDLTKMQTNKHLVSILSLVNFSQTGSDGLLSNQIHEEFDCS